MEAFFFHPKVVHIPIALSVLMPLIAAGSLVAWWRGWLPAKSWIFVIGLQAVLVGSGVAALKTGEVEEERVEAYVAEPLIEAHEEAAEVFVWGSGAILGIMLLALALSRRPAGLALAAGATLGTLIILALGYRTGTAGGELVYRHGAAQAYVSGTPPSTAVQFGDVTADPDDD